MKIKEIDSEKLDYEPNSIVVLPVETHDDSLPTLYTSDTLSFVKSLQSKVAIEYLKPPEATFEQRSIEWFGPAIYISSKLLTENPDLINIFFDAFKEYIEGVLPRKEKSKIKLKVICKKTEKTRSTEIDYEGDIDGLRELKDAISKALGD
ncbi:TPA: hypothetical protein ACKP12_000514 [Serratia marcescens]|nr:hypothetical protein [Serratia marcescens]